MSVVAEIQELTPQEIMFAQEYTSSWDEREAALKAGYPDNQLTRARALKLTERPDVRRYILSLLSERRQENEVVVKKILQKYMQIAFVSLSDFEDSHGNPKPLNKLDPNASAAVLNFTTKFWRNKKGRLRKQYFYKLHDPLPALAQLSKFFGLDAKAAANEAATIEDTLDRIRAAKANERMERAIDTSADRLRIAR